jgi:hypothetical protein
MSDCQEFEGSEGKNTASRYTDNAAMVQLASWHIMPAAHLFLLLLILKLIWCRARVVCCWAKLLFLLHQLVEEGNAGNMLQEAVVQ